MRLLFQCEVNRCDIRLESTGRNEGIVYAGMCRNGYSNLSKHLNASNFRNKIKEKNLRCYSQRLKDFSRILSLLVHGMTSILR